MFEDYLIDASHFIEIAKATQNDSRTKIRNYRVSIFLTSGALEAFINYLGETFNDNPSLSLHERDFLNDVQTEINPSKASLEKREKFQSLENKVKYLINKFSVPMDIARNPEWSHFKSFKVFRDSLVHPRSQAIDFMEQDYNKHAEQGLKSSIFIIDQLLNGIFGKGLRQQVLDLANI